MADPYVRTVGAPVVDFDGVPIVVGVDYDTVTLRAGNTLVRLTSGTAEDFAALFVAACWAAGANAERMREDGL
ncbi:MAG: hypothetical protein M0030_03375 [Actinomycetota bacterium]|nr:hypothetical protein [Actinomycetota bacterium]